MSDLIQSAADALFVPWLVVILFGTGIFLTFRYRFIQLTHFAEALRNFVAPRDATARGALPPFQSFMTALATTVGTGNIAGVAAAIVTGGPGALFWIWAYGFVATTIKLTEAVLGVQYRDQRGSAVLSGPMFYLRDGLRSPRLAWVYALVAGVAALTTTPFTQPNSIAVVWESELSVPTWVTGLAVAVLTWMVIIGGIRWIGRVMEKLAPLKVGLYLIGGVIVIVSFGSQLPDVLALVFREAFSFRATAGGSLGIIVAMRYGLARGLYANEAGYGTAAVAYGTAQSSEPRRQGLNAVMETFIVSFVTSSISGLAILVTGVWEAGQTSTAAVAQAFDQAMPGVGGLVVAVCAFLFGYGTLIGWSYYGERFLAYVLGERVTIPYRWIYCLLIPFGAMARVELVWAWGDLMNALQIFPNLVGVVGLSALVATIVRRAHPKSIG
ncbi:MAG: amino acid carrier protein [Luteitalea sp.]|nr:amino acid carrier protein [Luteitalea sp.]